MLRYVAFAKKFTYNELVFTTENKYVCDNLSNLLTILYTPMIEKTSGLRVRNSKNPLITVKLPNEDDCNRILRALVILKRCFTKIKQSKYIRRRTDFSIFKRRISFLW